MAPGLILALVLGVAALLFWLGRSRRPYPSWAAFLLHLPWRPSSFTPERAAIRHGIAPGMAVLEIGPGSGHLSPAARRRAGPAGRLVCLDIQPAMLRKLRDRARAETPALVCGSGSSLPLRARAFDVVFLVHVLGEIPDPVAALRECARVLRPGGVVAITEGLPDPDYISPRRLEALAAEAGLRPTAREGARFFYTMRFAARG